MARPTMAPARLRSPARSRRSAARSSRLPTPPLAMTGRVVASSTAPSCWRSGPARVHGRELVDELRALDGARPDDDARRAAGEELARDLGAADPPTHLDPAR